MRPKELNVGREVAALERMTVKQLKKRYAQVFGETTTGQQPHLALQADRLAAQALAEVTSPNAPCRAAGLARDADLRLNPARREGRGRAGPGATGEGGLRGRSTAAAGHGHHRKYKGGTVQVKVLAEGLSMPARSMAH